MVTGGGRQILTTPKKVPKVGWELIFLTGKDDSWHKLAVLEDQYAVDQKKKKSIFT